MNQTQFPELNRRGFLTLLGGALTTGSHDVIAQTSKNLVEKVEPGYKTNSYISSHPETPFGVKFQGSYNGDDAKWVPNQVNVKPGEHYRHELKMRSNVPAQGHVNLTLTDGTETYPELHTWLGHNNRVIPSTSMQVKKIVATIIIPTKDKLAILLKEQRRPHLISAEPEKMRTWIAIGEQQDDQLLTYEGGQLEVGDVKLTRI